MDKPRFYSVTSINILPESRDVNGIYHLRTADGFKVYRVSNTPPRDFIELKASVNNNIQIIDGDDHGGVVEDSADYILIRSGSGSVITLPDPERNKGKVITLVHNSNTLSGVYSIVPKIMLRPNGTIGIEFLRGLGYANPNEPISVSAISDGVSWHALHTRY